MAWTAPMTAVANTVFTADQFNVHVRDNLLETAPAKATTAGGYFAATGTNAIAQRTADSSTLVTPQTTTSTSYVNLATVGPEVTVTTGTSAFVFVSGGCRISTGSGTAFMSFAVSGATTRAANDDDSTYNTTSSDGRFSQYTLVTGLTAGSNTFTAKYRVSAGTGTFIGRRIVVMPL